MNDACALEGSDFVVWERSKSFVDRRSEIFMGGVEVVLIREVGFS